MTIVLLYLTYNKYKSIVIFDSLERSERQGTTTERRRERRMYRC